MQDEIYMRRALSLALLGGRRVSPNPMVGCVLVYQNKVIAEGWHRYFGGPHAEIEAMSRVADQSLLSRATAYVNLEPCAHQGKTPPCTEALIRARLRRVVIGCSDPHPQVHGRGIKTLLSRQIKVKVGVLEAESRYLNRRFFTFVEQQRPYIILKWAQSSDRFIAPDRPKGQYWISSPQSRRLLHLWRSEEAAILVGYRTALCDDPQLSVRELRGEQPLRVVIDREASLPSSLRMWDAQAPSLAYSSHKDLPPNYIGLPKKHFLQQMMQDLYQRGILSMIVEGGRSTLDTFLEAGLWDEARVITAPKLLHQGLGAPHLSASLLRERLSICHDQLQLYFRST